MDGQKRVTGRPPKRGAAGVVLTARVDADLRAWVTDEAARRGETISAVVERALEAARGGADVPDSSCV